MRMRHDILQTMELHRIVACLLCGNVAAAATLAPFTVASVNACLGAGSAPGACFDRLGRGVFDGSLLTVKSTLSSPAVEGQLSINSTAQAGYGVLRAGTSSTLDVS